MENNEVEKFGTSHAWSKELGINEVTLARRLAQAEGVSGRDGIGRLRLFYSETEVRRLCIDLLASVPQGDKEDFIYLESEAGTIQRFGTKSAWSRELGVSTETLRLRLRGLNGIAGKSKRNVQGLFFSEEDVRERCPEHFLPDLLQADDFGFFVKNEERYGTSFSWAKEFGVTHPLMRSLLAYEKGVSGRASTGQVIQEGFYPNSVVQHRVSWLQALPRADEAGFLQFQNGESERFASGRTWAKIFGIAKSTLAARLKDYEGVTGRTEQGNILERSFFPESVVRERCKDLLSSRNGN